MLRSSIHKKILIKVVIVISLIAGTVVMYKSQSKQIEKLEKQEKKAKGKANELESRFKNFDRRKSQIEKAFNTWLELSKNNEKFEGLKISIMKGITDSMKEKHRLNDLDIKMAKPKILSGEYRSVSVGVEASEIRMGIDAHSDTQILFFLYDFLRNVPGYVDVTSFSLVRNHELNSSTFLRIAEDVGFSPVSADIVFVWHELKSK